MQSGPQQNDVETNEKAAPTIGQSDKPSPTNPLLQKWTTYQGKGYSFQYPPQWVPQEFTTNNGGKIIRIKPQQLPEGVEYPHFLLQVEPFSKDAIAMKKEVLKGLGLKESITKVGRADAEKFSGTIPFKTVNNQRVDEPLQDTTILLVQRDTLYTFKYEYEGEVNKDLDRYFQDFTDSFKTTAF